ncbi:MAG: hypothetical protein EVA67_06530 [OM182 bacterium]|nr:MAG: hypothetical protein EVA67_06530 [OM182 bacterium]
MNTTRFSAVALALALGASLLAPLPSQLVSAARASSDNGRAPASSTQLSITHQGRSRHYRLHVPDSLPARAPLVVAMHGFGSSAQRLQSYSGIDAVADREGFIVAYPQGTQDVQGRTFFNVGYQFHSASDVDDVAFVIAVVNHVRQHMDAGFGIALSSVFATGMSNGGDMSFYLACKASKHFDAIAPVTGTMMTSWQHDCTPEKPIPVLAVNGTEDAVTLPEGDPTNRDGWGAYLSTEDVIQHWVNHYRLDDVQQESLPNPSFLDGSRVERVRYTASDSDMVVEFLRVVGGGHAWPGAPMAWWRPRAWLAWGFPNQDIDAAEEIWRFFEQYK